METFLITLIVILVLATLVWGFIYLKIYGDLRMAKKQVNDCGRRLGLVEDQIKLFQKDIERIDSKITIIEQTVRGGLNG